MEVSVSLVASLSCLGQTFTFLFLSAGSLTPGHSSSQNLLLEFSDSGIYYD